MSYVIKDGELYHWGVVGMKWGVRRYQNADGTLTEAGKRRALKQKQKNLKKARDAKEQKAKRQKLARDGKIPISKMTDDELKMRIERLRLEETVKNLTKSTYSPDVVDRGKVFTKKYAGEAVKGILWDNFVDLGRQAVKAAVVKAYNNKTGYEAIYTNNKRKS